MLLIKLHCASILVNMIAEVLYFHAVVIMNLSEFEMAWTWTHSI